MRSRVDVKRSSMTFTFLATLLCTAAAQWSLVRATTEHINATQYLNATVLPFDPGVGHAARSVVV